ncbi:MAG: hypothetical protein NTZ64_03235, partial [Polaromonas sp.]|nr:hypothetical protein [Polaromonas sp.]
MTADAVCIAFCDPGLGLPCAGGKISAILDSFSTTGSDVSDVPSRRSSKPEDKRGFLQKLAEMLH